MSIAFLFVWGQVYFETLQTNICKIAFYRICDHYCMVKWPRNIKPSPNNILV